MSNIKNKSKDPKPTDFSKKELVININDGSLFYKSNKGLHKISPSSGVSTVAGLDGTPGDTGDTGLTGLTGDTGDTGADAITLSLSSTSNVFSFDNSTDIYPTPSVVTITATQNNQDTDLTFASLITHTNALTPNETFDFASNITNGSGVATWNITPDGTGVFPITCTVSNGNPVKTATVILHQITGGDDGVTLPGVNGDSYFNDHDNDVVASTTTTNISIDSKIGIGTGFGITGAWNNPSEQLELNGNLLLNSGHIRSTGDIDLLTDDGGTHAEDKAFIKIKSSVAATDIKGDLNLTQNHTLTGDPTSGEEGAYNGYPQVEISAYNAFTEETTYTYYDDYSQGYFAAGGVGNFTCEGDASIGKYLTVGWNTSIGGDPTNTTTIGAVFPSGQYSAPKGSIIALGDIYGNGVKTTSDIKLKKNINSIEDSLSKILSLRGVGFEWKDKERGKGIQQGFIAQEVEKIIPELITGGETKYVNYQGIIPVLVEAIKEQQKQIDELKSKLK